MGPNTLEDDPEAVSADARPDQPVEASSLPSQPLALEALRPSIESAPCTACALGQRLRQAGFLGCLGSVGDALDNAVAGSFFASLQTELLDRRSWSNRHQLAQAIFEWVEAWHNPRRRHSVLGSLSPVQFEAAHTGLQKVA